MFGRLHLNDFLAVRSPRAARAVRAVRDKPGSRTGRRTRARARFRVAVLLLPLALLPATTDAATTDAAATDFAETAGPAAWAWPVASGADRVLRGFEAPASPYAAGHRGIDVAAGPGDAVFAVADGVVLFTGTVVDRPTLSIGHPGDLVSSIEPVAASVVVGERVHRGQFVGRVAAGGHCAAQCVHLGVRLHGEYLSPLRFLGGIPRAVLLPLDAAATRAEAADRARPERERPFWRALRGSAQ
jgi:murein DD-endopeptidase MepM/ murein hydrolase activator NlpD